MPATIDDPMIVDEIGQTLRTCRTALPAISSDDLFPIERPLGGCRDLLSRWLRVGKLGTAYSPRDGTPRRRSSGLWDGSVGDCNGRHRCDADHLTPHQPLWQRDHDARHRHRLDSCSHPAGPRTGAHKLHSGRARLRSHDRQHGCALVVAVAANSARSADSY